MLVFHIFQYLACRIKIETNHFQRLQKAVDSIILDKFGSMALDATSFGYVLAQQIDSLQENFIFNLSLGF